MWTPQWLPISFLDRKKDDTYMVRVENAGGDGTGSGWIDKGYFADDAQIWTDDAGTRIERSPWKITAFAPWPNLTDIEVSHASDCAVHNEPAMPNGPCDCGAELKSKAAFRGWNKPTNRKEHDMSYSFSVTADTKDEAGIKVEAELGKVVAAQPTHEFDRQAAQNAAEAFIDVLADPGESQCVTVSMSGSLSWRDANVFTGASVNVSAYLAPKAKP